MKELKWTYEKPTVEGFYFWRDNPSRGASYVVRVIINGGRLWAYGHGEDFVNRWVGQFAGPIEEPVE